MKNIKNSLMPIILIGCIIIINIVSIIILKEINILALIASIIGVTSVVLSSKGNILSYYLGIISTIAYIIIAINSKFYGTVILQGLFFLPMNFLGIYNWKKHLNKNSNIVKTKEMSISKTILLFLIGLSFGLLYSFILKLINGNSPILDAIITGLSLIAMYLSVKRYRENWIFFSILSFTNIIMWIIAAINNNSNGIIMALTWTVYLIIDIYGIITWKKLIEKKKEVIKDGL